MKIQIASDLHLEFLESRFSGYRAVEPADADLLVLAGDIHRAARAIDVFADWPVPVLYVRGNHEAYHEELGELDGRLRAASAGGNVRFLECDEYRQDGVRFLGCCLWTDYQLDPAMQRAAMAEAERKLSDHRAIRIAEAGFTAADALRLHRQSRAWLTAKLDEDFTGATVVVTHHGPHPRSIHPRYAGMPLNAAFVSDLTPLVDKADLWIHGHVHDSFDYTVARARVVANPRGYALNRASADTPGRIVWENPRFDPQLVVQLPA